MNEEQTNTPATPVLRYISLILSDVFSPLLSPTYAMVIALWLTPMCILPLGTRAWTVIGVFFLTALVPGLSLLLLVRLKKIKDTDVSDHKERFLPFTIAIACYLLTVLFLYNINAPRWMLAFMWGATGAAVIAGIISFKWKISAHATANAGLVGFVAWLAHRHALLIEPLTAVSIVIILLGLVCWARLYLYKHTPLQVLAGSALGAGIILATLAL